MQIPSYQIQNVLKVYSRQLSQGKIPGRNNIANANKISADSVTISPEGKRQAIIDKVASNIVVHEYGITTDRVKPAVHYGAVSYPLE